MSVNRNEQIRNISIIAHVDHGKTTLVDAMFRQSGVFREGQEVSDRLMDNMDLERERGITIAAKNCAVAWNGVKINIIDTPGHADFGGEVERTLSMADGALLLVDAAEGPLPQTRFVLSKALQDNLQVIVVINKVDRPDARPSKVLDEVYDLFIDLDANEDQLDFPVLYAIGRDGVAANEPFSSAEEALSAAGEQSGTGSVPAAATGEPGSAATTQPGDGADQQPASDQASSVPNRRGLEPLFDTILTQIPGPAVHEEQPFQMLVADLGYSDFLGRLAIGRIHNRPVAANDALVRIDTEGRQKPLKVSRLQVYKGMTTAEAKRAEPGDIVVLAGIDEVHIGDTICTADNPKAMRRITVDEPTVSMLISRNTSPFAGREGTFIQSSKIGERLFKETMRNVSLQVEETEDKDAYLVKGRGEFQMAILIETMRREGFELTVGRPHVIYRRENGKLQEPIERLFIDCGEDYVGVVTEKLSLRKARLVNMVNHSSGRVRMEFSAPARALIGFRDELLTDTRGTGIMNAQLEGYEEYRGDFPSRQSGSLVSDRQGSSVPYALYNLEPRGVLFIGAGESVYEGMIVGEHNRDNDLDVNPCKTKKLTNVRAAARDENVVLSPPHTMTLEAALSFIRDDELVEVTPHSLRMRKSALTASERKRQQKSTAE